MFREFNVFKMFREFNEFKMWRYNESDNKHMKQMIAKCARKARQTDTHTHTQRLRQNKSTELKMKYNYPNSQKLIGTSKPKNNRPIQTPFTVISPRK